ncbi:MAG: hypothetical protein JWO84_596 [Parcubacteria group bacterium]|nr:hypothetical protein [Parcubacteria group bacterium]
METTQNPNQQQTKRAAVGGLAVVGFIALILIGIATAIYAASFLPKAFSRLSTANVFLSSASTPNDTNTLQPVNNPSVVVGTSSAPTSIPLSPAPTTTVPPAYTAPTPTTPAYTAPATPTYVAPKPAQVVPTYTVVQVPQNYYGLPDLVTTITSVGYLRNSGDTTSFVAATAVPNGYQGAVRFVVANRGTGVSNSWTFSANLPSASNSNYTSSYQRSLNPGDSIVFTLGFDGTSNGNGTIRITADANNNVQESNENNNTDSASIYVNGTNYGTNNYGSGSYDSNGQYCSGGTYYSGGRYYCNTYSNTTTSNGSYDSSGTYCQYGTYVTAGRTYCQSSSIANGNSTHYDSNGNYCSFGTYYQTGRYYCSGPYSNSNTNSATYDSNGQYCSAGTYYSNGRTYCNSSNNSSNLYDSNGNYCSAGTYSSNGRTYCY